MSKVHEYACMILITCNVASEKTHSHLLRLANRYRRGVCHPARKGGKAEVWPRISCL